MRYLIEVSYKGTKYAGFQVQANANTIQSELEKALALVYRTSISLTGSSRTDAGVHAIQNFFHFDLDMEIDTARKYNLNAVLPHDIVVKSLHRVSDHFHSRFSAVAREYKYFITTARDPFTTDTSWYYPYSIDPDLLNIAAQRLFTHNDYTTFSKRNTQVKSYLCTITKSKWIQEGDTLIYNVQANRFLRGMVRGLVGTMLLVGRKKISVEEFEKIIVAKDNSRASFASPATGLFLVKVQYP